MAVMEAVDLTAAGVTAATVGAVVCTFTESRLTQLAAAVASVRAQTRPVQRLLVLVDGTQELTDRVRAAIPGLRDDEVACLGSNQGVSAARNRAVELLDVDLVAFLDDDAVAEPDWIEELLVPLTDPTVIGVTGRSEPVFGGPRPRWLTDEFLWTVGCSYRGMPEKTARVRNFYGGCALLRRPVFVGLGGFRTDIGHLDGEVGGGEEAEFCLRAVGATGGTFAFTPAAAIHHQVPRARLTSSYFRRRCYSEGVMKARLARLLPPGALAAERTFAGQLPRAFVRSMTGRGDGAASALGLVRGSWWVVCGLVVGQAQTWRLPGGRGR